MTSRQPLFVAILIFSMLCVSCISAPFKSPEWPKYLPSLRYYESVYAEDENNRAVQTKEEYLKWVIRFYEGWNLYQDGWKRTSRDILLSVDDADKKNTLRSKLAHLGKLISGEWAKNSYDRTIRSRELSIWAQALLKSINRNKEAQLIDRVTRDVNALRAHELDRLDISVKRYFDVAKDEYENEKL